MSTHERTRKARVLAIVVTHEGKDWVDYVFESLRRSQVEVSVLCVDNASTDGTVDQIKTSYPDVTVIELHANVGFGAANNVGLRVFHDHGYDYALLINQDARIESDALGRLIDVAIQHEQFGIVSPVHRGWKDETLDRQFVKYVSDGAPDLWRDLLLGHPTSLVYEVHFVNAALWLLTRECVERVGGFDELFFHYGEDQDYADRARRQGLKVGVVPNALANHARDRYPGRSGQSRTLHEVGNLLLEYRRRCEGDLRLTGHFVRRFIADAVTGLVMSGPRRFVHVVGAYVRFARVVREHGDDAGRLFR